MTRSTSTTPSTTPSTASATTTRATPGAITLPLTRRRHVDLLRTAAQRCPR